MYCPKCLGPIEESVVKAQRYPCFDGLEVAFSCPCCGRSFFCIITPASFMEDLGKPSAGAVGITQRLESPFLEVT